MNVNVLFFGRFRELAVRDRLVPLKEGARLADLLEQLNQEYGDEFRNEVNNKEQVHILVNGQFHNILEDINTQLQDGDVVVLMPLATGG